MLHLNTTMKMLWSLQKAIVTKPLIVFKSVSGNVRNFVKRVGYESLEITDSNALNEVADNFVIIAPTYESIMLEDLEDFIDLNHENCIGVVGSGNYNFGNDYVFTAKDISEKYDIPIIYDFENRGTKKDIIKFQQIIEGMSGKNDN